MILTRPDMEYCCYVQQHRITASTEHCNAGGFESREIPLQLQGRKTPNFPHREKQTVSKWRGFEVSFEPLQSPNFGTSLTILGCRRKCLLSGPIWEEVERGVGFREYVAGAVIKPSAAYKQNKSHKPKPEATQVYASQRPQPRTQNCQNCDNGGWQVGK